MIRIWSLALVLTIVPLMIVVLVARPLIPLVIWLRILIVPLVIPLVRWHIGVPWIVLIPVSPISMILIPVPQLQLPLLIFS